MNLKNRLMASVMVALAMSISACDPKLLAEQVPVGMEAEATEYAQAYVPQNEDERTGRLEFIEILSSRVQGQLQVRIEHLELINHCFEVRSIGSGEVGPECDGIAFWD